MHFFRWVYDINGYMLDKHITWYLPPSHKMQNPHCPFCLTWSMPLSTRRRCFYDHTHFAMTELSLLCKIYCIYRIGDSMLMNFIPILSPHPSSHGHHNVHNKWIRTKGQSPDIYDWDIINCWVNVTIKYCTDIYALSMNSWDITKGTSWLLCTINILAWTCTKLHVFL